MSITQDVIMQEHEKNKEFGLTFLQSLGIVLIYDFILKGIIVTVFNQVNVERFDLWIQNLFIAAGELIAALIVVWVLLKKMKSGSEVKFRLEFIGLFSFKLLGILLLVMFGYILWYQNSLGLLIDKIPHSEFFEKLMIQIEKEFEDNPYQILFGTFVIAPVYEEILFRGILLSGLLKKYKPVNAIIISSLIFATSHLNIYQFINSFLGGLLLGVVYYETRSLFLCIGIHVFNNVVPAILFYMGFSAGIVYFIPGVIIFILGLKLLIDYFHRRSVVSTCFNNALFDQFLKKEG